MLPAVRVEASQTEKNPLAISSSSVTKPAARPVVRRTLVAPMLPLPEVRTSGPVVHLTTRYPKGIPPTRYAATSARMAGSIEPGIVGSAELRYSPRPLFRKRKLRKFSVHGTRRRGSAVIEIKALRGESSEFERWQTRDGLQERRQLLGCFDAREREVRRISARFSGYSQRGQDLVSFAGQVDESATGVNSGPEDARRVRIREEPDLFDSD